jgi:type IV pilus assembly protein PilV
MSMKHVSTSIEIGAGPNGVRTGKPGAHQRGATLIEVLVSVVLLSFGIVGLAGLQFNGTKFNHSAYLRSQGTALAYDLADRVRANLCPGNTVCAAYITGQDDLFDGDAAQTCGLELGDLANSDNMAAADVNQWKHCLEDRLPQGRGVVTLLAAGVPYDDECDQPVHAAAGTDLLVIEVNWVERRFDAVEVRECVVVRTEVRPL